MIISPQELDQIAESVCREHELAFEGFVAEGAFKRVYRARSPGGSCVAVKLIDPSRSNIDRTEREIDAMKKCFSPHLSRLFYEGTFRGEKGLVTYFTEELFEGGSLAQLIQQEGPLAPAMISGFIRPLGEGLAQLAELYLVHRDIKPENIMFRANSRSPVLTDFGLVRDLAKSSLTQTWHPAGPGTPFFSAPEQLNNDKGMIGSRTDQFSLGVTLAYSLTGRHPYQRREAAEGDAIAAVADRSGPSDEFILSARQSGLSPLVKMIQPWPIQRFPSPSTMINAFALK